jgi:hypothetical protein
LREGVVQVETGDRDGDSGSDDNGVESKGEENMGTKKGVKRKARKDETSGDDSITGRESKKARRAGSKQPKSESSDEDDTAAKLKTESADDHEVLSPGAKIKSESPSWNGFSDGD